MEQENQTQNQYFTVQTQHPAVMRFPVSLGHTIDFPDGIPGFEHVKQYELRSYEEFRPFIFLNAVGDEDLGFICADIFFLRQDYEVNVSKEILDRLDCTDLQDLAVLSIVTVGTTAEETTANLFSPLLINVNTRKGMQVILENSNYPIQYPIWENLKTSATESDSHEENSEAAENQTNYAEGFE